MAMGAHQRSGRGEAVWLTPPELVEDLGPFDLDPCFGAPRPWSTAAEHYGPDAAGGLGGLHAPWHGMVWCNPPYGHHAGQWLARCAEHGSAIALIFARTETEDFHRQVWMKASAVLFIEGRLSFRAPSGARVEGTAGAPSVLVAYGDEAVDRLRAASVRGHFIDLQQAQKDGDGKEG